MTPSAISAIYTSDIISLLDVHKPEVRKELVARRGDMKSSYFLNLQNMGLEESVANDTFSHFEDDWYHVQVHVRANVAQPAIGDPISFVLDTTDLDTSNRFYIQERDILLFANDVVGLVTDIDVTAPAAPIVTVEPLDATDRFPALTAGEDLSIISDAFAERSNQPDSSLSGVTEYENDCQIIKTTVGASGTELSNQTWLQLKGIDNAPYYSKAMLELDYRHTLKIDGAMLMNKRTTNTDALDSYTGTAVKTTEGLFPYVDRVGITYNYAPATFDTDDFDTMVRQLDAENTGPVSMAWLGIQLHQTVENAMVSYFATASTSNPYIRSSMFGGNEAQEATVNYTSFTKSDRTWMFKRFGNLSNPKTYGGDAYTFPQQGIVLSLDSTQDKKNPNKKLSCVGMRYKAFGDYNRRTRLWRDGAAIVKIGDIDEDKTYQLSHVGAEHSMGNKMIRMVPV